jgi:glycosyltransferase involved in cell wall biosynthesis
MLQYMACALPVVVSAVGMNKDLLAAGDIGYGVSPGASWLEPLEHLVEQAELRQRMGLAGRRVVESGYTTVQVAHALANYLHELKNP